MNLLGILIIKIFNRRFAIFILFCCFKFVQTASYWLSWPISFKLKSTPYYSEKSCMDRLNRLRNINDIQPNMIMFCYKLCAI